MKSEITYVRMKMNKPSRSQTGSSKDSYEVFNVKQTKKLPDLDTDGITQYVEKYT